MFQLEEFQLDEFQLEEFQLDEFQLDESQTDATVPFAAQLAPGAQTSAAAFRSSCTRS